MMMHTIFTTLADIAPFSWREVAVPSISLCVQEHKITIFNSYNYSTAIERYIVNCFGLRFCHLISTDNNKFRYVRGAIWQSRQPALKQQQHQNNKQNLDSFFLLFSCLGFNYCQ